MRMTAEILKQGAELLKRDEIEERHKILQWLWKGDVWQRQDVLAKKRVHDTGNWFLKSDEFKNWATGKSSLSIICRGMGTHSLFTADMFCSWGWEVIYEVIAS
jgi:hypothetical protein